MKRLRSRRHAFAVLALLGWVLLAEGLLVVHRIDHASTGHAVSCALCSAADHQAATFEDLPQPLVAAATSAVVSFFVTAQTVERVSSYRSRAPPGYLPT